MGARSVYGMACLITPLVERQSMSNNEQKEKLQTDLEWLREQREEHERRKWALARIRGILAWVVGVFTTLWAGFDSWVKLTDWIKK